MSMSMSMSASKLMVFHLILKSRRLKWWWKRFLFLELCLLFLLLLFFFFFLFLLMTWHLMMCINIKYWYGCWRVNWDTHEIWQTINFEKKKKSDRWAYLKFVQNLRTIFLKLETQTLNLNKIKPTFYSLTNYSSLIKTHHKNVGFD